LRCGCGAFRAPRRPTGSEPRRHAGYGKIDPAVTWKKLRALREGADIAAARLARAPGATTRLP
jgi:hypothetical protein